MVYCFIMSLDSVDQEFRQGTEDMPGLYITMSGALVRLTSQLKTEITWRCLYSHVQCLMLAVVWDLSWSHQPEHPPVASPHGRVSLQHGSLRVTGLFTQWLRAPKSPTFLKHFPINQSHSSSRPQRKQYIKHWGFFTYLLIFYKSQGKAGITTLYKKRKDDSYVQRHADNYTGK